jgi:hypothetical protein
MLNRFQMMYICTYIEEISGRYGKDKEALEEVYL